MKNYILRMKGKEKSPPRKPVGKIMWSWVGSFFGILLILVFEKYLFSRGVESFSVIGSFGASAVLIYGAPLADFSQPRNLIGGHVVSAIVGVTISILMPSSSSIVLSGALAVSLAIVAMHSSRTMHPPGGATALIAVMGGEKVRSLGYMYAISPVLSGALLLLLVALLVNNLSANPKRHYPLYWI